MPKSKFVIDENGRQCCRCSKYKPWKEFSKDKHNFYKHQGICKECSSTKRQTKFPMVPGPKPKFKFMKKDDLLNEEIDFTKPIDIKQLLDINIFSKDEIRELIHKILFYKAAPYRMDLIEIYKRHFHARSAIMCAKIYAEFKEAAENGEDFETYLNSDRKYRKDGKRILAGGKK